MANNSRASGRITLKGNWTQEAIDAFEPVLDLWEFYGEYGIQKCDYFDEEHLSAYFSGCGRWPFSGALASFEEWTRQWLKDNPKRPDGEPICTTTEEQYEYFLKIMSENNLIIEMDFENESEDCFVHEIGKFTSGDGSCISYETISSDDNGLFWDDYDRSALGEAVDCFERFCTDVDRRKLRKWIKKNVFSTDIFKRTDDYEEIIMYFGDHGEDLFYSFFLAFSPDTEEWEDFDGLYEEVWGTPIEGTKEYEDSDKDCDDEDVDENVEKIDTESSILELLAWGENFRKRMLGK